MPTQVELQKQAREKRDQAAQARRWAPQMSLTLDQNRLLQIAAQLDSEAAELERQASTSQTQPPGYSTTQPMQQVSTTQPQPMQQVQQQQQQQEPDVPEGGKDPKAEGR